MTKLFNNDEDFRKFLSVNAGFTVANLNNQLEEALTAYIFPYCPATQIEESKKGTDDKSIELIRIVKNAVANLGMYLYFPIAKVQITNGGINYTADKARQASSEDKEELLNSFRRTGLLAIETMLKFLEENEASFALWKNSSTYTKYTSLLVRTASEFGIINESRQVFLQLIPYIKDVEFDIIKSAIPADILTKLYSRSFGSDAGVKAIYESLLIDYVQVIVRNLSLAQAVAAMAVVKDKANTLTVYDDTASGKSTGHKEAPQTKLTLWKEDLEKRGYSRLIKMNQYILDNATALGQTVISETENIAYRNLSSNGTAFF